MTERCAPLQAFASVSSAPARRGHANTPRCGQALGCCRLHAPVQRRVQCARRAALGQAPGLASPDMSGQCGVSTNMYGHARTTPLAAPSPPKGGSRCSSQAAEPPRAPDEEDATWDATNLDRTRRIGRTVGIQGWTVVEIPSTPPGRHHKHVHPSGRPPPRLAGAPPRSGRPSLPSPSSSASRSLTLSHLAAAAATPLRRDRLLGAAGRHGARRVTSAPRAHPPGVLASRRKGR